MNEIDRQRLKEAVSLEGWNEFIEELHIPLDLRPALAARRPELIALARRRTLGPAEVDELYKLIANLFQTNEALRVHAEETARKVGDWVQAVDTMRTFAIDVEYFANYTRRPTEDEY